MFIWVMVAMKKMNVHEIKKTTLWLGLFFLLLFLISILLSWRAYFGMVEEKVVTLENVYLSPQKGRNGPTVITITSGGSILYTARCVGLEYSVCRPSNMNQGGIYAKNITFLELIKGDGVVLEINHADERMRNSHSQEFAVEKYLDVERRTPNMFLICTTLFLSIYLISRGLTRNR